MVFLHCYIGSDHAGFQLKETVKRALKGKYDFEDIGCFSAARVDYADIALGTAKRVAAEKGAMGVLICGTGIGMGIVANKVRGIRAAVIYDGFTAKMARAHNNANIICLGARNILPQDAVLLVRAFLETGFEGHEKGGERHLKRVNQISEIERQNFRQEKPEIQATKKRQAGKKRFE
jgi:RpiB/LacA/LacB family sugar-phosphate isomerase